MNKLATKILGAVLSLSMMTALLPTMAMAADAAAKEATDGYFKLEESDLAATSSANIQGGTNAAYSGGKMISTNTGNPDVLPYLEFKINVEKAGSYKLWWYGTDMGYEYCSPVSLTLDGTTDINHAKYGSEIWVSSTRTAYHTADVSLSEGEHTIRWTVTGKAPSSPSYFIGTFDFMMIYPESYAWTPSITGLPVAPTYVDFDEVGYAWVEGEDAAKNYGFSNTLTDTTDVKFSGGEAVGLNTTSAPTGGSYYLDYYLNVPADGTYKIWIRGIKTESEYMSPAKLTFNGETIATTAYGSDSWWGNGYCFTWRQATANLTAGKYDISYVVDALSLSNRYGAMLDVMVIYPESYTWSPSLDTRPSVPVYVNKGWFEAEEVTSRNSSYYASGHADCSNASGLKISTASAPDSNGYYIDFEVLTEAGSYDIYFRGSDDAYSAQYISPSQLFVNGTEKEFVNVAQKSDGWVNDVCIGWNKITAPVTLEKTTNTIRWTVTQEKGAGGYQAYLDAVVLVPAGVPFAPVANDIAATKADYELCTLLAGYDLANITSDITLPATLEDGTTEVVWTSDNAAITNAGVVTRPTNGQDATVNLTATAGTASKVFTLTVKNLSAYDVENFAISGNVRPEQTVTATADVTVNIGDARDINLIIAVYDEYGKMLGVDMDTKNVGSTEVPLSISYTIDAEDTDVSYAKAFLWSEFGNLTPIKPFISLGL